VSDPGSFAQTLLGDGSGSAAQLRRLGAGLALSAVFGLAIGARYGLPAMAVHAAGVPLGLLAVAGLAAPALYVGIAHAGLPLEGATVLEAVARGAATCGLVLAGLAPAALLVTVSVESGLGAAALAACCLAAGGTLGLRELSATLFAPLAETEVANAKLRAGWLTALFALFATVLVLRVWWLALPMLGRPYLTGGM
jgi:hypothetical protein